MTTEPTRTPQPGEWWECAEGKERFLVINANGKELTLRYIDYIAPGIADDFFMAQVRHLHGCTGWDWEEPKDEK